MDLVVSELSVPVEPVRLEQRRDGDGAWRVDVQWRNLGEFGELGRLASRPEVWCPRRSLRLGKTLGCGLRHVA